ncbi:MAG: sigma-70 family RNA polymerase sigma factor [Acidobacteria bacterium]|jgi:RNA polymerase sigma-70 factor (ECF subfamily)|nr:sigma-70 family RNA polymerase sigma factor [Acidobacteriota bacterium]
MGDEADHDDVRRVLDGDVEAFAGIVRRWQGPLVNLAWRFTHDRGRAEELAQEAFLKVFRNLSHWRGEGTFSTWLFAVATNVFRSALRRAPALPLPDELAERLPAEDDPERDAVARDEQAAVRRALAALPARYREALVLFYFHEMDVAEAAKSLGVPEGTIKARLSRGREMMRQRLAGRVIAPAAAEGR